jgi:6-pyruvoyltetrahydropterin/6-carboxytetrahydropterin synthase|tara:strand:+ start:4322 stop:4900 length:579 start_codon:yes stop_codon:yes gene_type:complete
MPFQSTKIINLGSCAFRQPKATSHCRFIHGYRLKAKFWFESNKLDSNNWVVDFGSLKHLKKVLEKQFDHTLCIDSNDPLLADLQSLNDRGAADIRIMDGVGIEMIAKWCYGAANDHLDRGTMPNGARCVKVEVWEHEGNSAIYNGSSAVKQDDSMQLLFEDLKRKHSEPDKSEENKKPEEDKSTWDLGTSWI